MAQLNFNADGGIRTLEAVLRRRLTPDEDKKFREIFTGLENQEFRDRFIVAAKIGLEKFQDKKDASGRIIQRDLLEILGGITDSRFFDIRTHKFSDEVRRLYLRANAIQSFIPQKVMLSLILVKMRKFPKRGVEYVARLVQADIK